MAEAGSSVKSTRSTHGMRKKKLTWKVDMKRNWSLNILFIPALVYTVIFSYIPMVGILMAFQDYKPSKSFFNQKWVGLANFRELFTTNTFPLAFRNTAVMGLLNVTIGFVAPIIFALLLSLLKNKKYKHTIQTISYMPNFVAAVVVTSLVKLFLGRDGALTQLFSLFGAPVQNWLANSLIPVFWMINTFMNIWTNIGMCSIIDVAAISTVSGDLHEAAAIDGANRFQRLIKITLPSIMPYIVMMWTLNIGTSMFVGFDKILLLYMPTTYDVVDVLQTFVYRMSFSQGAQYGISTACGLFQSVLGTAMLMISNYLSKKASGMSMF